MVEGAGLGGLLGLLAAGFLGATPEVRRRGEQLGLDALVPLVRLVPAVHGADLGLSRLLPLLRHRPRLRLRTGSPQGDRGYLRA